jgi:DNA-binding Xre family transcriptional regulator
MKIDVKRVLKDHFEATGEYITQKSLADEMVKAGIFKNVHSAQNMIQYNISGKAKSLDVDILEFLCKRFNKTLIDIIY